MMQRRIRSVSRLEEEQRIRHQSHKSPSSYSHFLEIDSPITPPQMGAFQQRTSAPAVMNILRFGDDSDSDDEEVDSRSAYDEHRFSSQSKVTQHSNEQSLSSFRFFDDSPVQQEMPRRPTEQPAQRRQPSKGALRVNTDLSTRKPAPQMVHHQESQQASYLPEFNAGNGDDLQVYVQRLLQGSRVDGLEADKNIEEAEVEEEEEFDDEEEDIYQSYNNHQHHHYRHHHSQPIKKTTNHVSPKSEPKSRVNRISALSMASDVSAVPSLIFSDPGHAQRPSTILTSPPFMPTIHGRPGSIHSLGSIPSINSIDSDRSWFMDDESNPSSPADAPAAERISFGDKVAMGMSMFDDDSSEDEEDVVNTRFNDIEDSAFPQSNRSSIQTPDSPYFILMGRQVTLTPLKDVAQPTSINIKKSKKSASPTSSSTSTTTASKHKKKSSLSIEVSLKKMKKLLGSSTSSTTEESSGGAEERPTSQVYTCASPRKRRSRRRTASSECIVLEALEKMNEVMLELGRDDLNRKSVVGLDLPGNQVSVEAYGELWW